LPRTLAQIRATLCALRGRASFASFDAPALPDEPAMKENPFDLTGRTALVTGASSGLGRQFAITLARAGAKVALAARREDRLKDAVQQIESEGGSAIAITLDVTVPAAIAAAFDKAEGAFGTVTVLVNAAGVPSQSFFTGTSDEEWRSVMDVNLDGVFRTAREGARRMQAANSGGAMINIASVLAFGVLKAVSTYAVSKAAVMQLTKAMALELARDNIRVNAIAPGYFSTEMNEDFLVTDAGRKLISKVPQARVGELHDLDGALLLLASDAGSFITGTTIPVDGGALLAMG
jgi:NAD(P)-dependent dehydrogenase (short-subunit alcohol dehydrogenase family)